MSIWQEVYCLQSVFRSKFILRSSFGIWWEIQPIQTVGFSQYLSGSMTYSDCVL